MNEVVLYESEGLTAVLVDNEAVELYCEGVHRITMTQAEWIGINTALEGVRPDWEAAKVTG